MTSPIGAIGGFGTFPVLGAVTGSERAGATTAAIGAGSPTSAASGSSFAEVLANSIDQLSAVQENSDVLAAQAATGDLQDAHDYMIASTEAQLATEMVVSLRNKGVEAFTEIMRMQI